MKLPPKIPPEQLFNYLLQLPFPSLPIQAKLEGQELRVRAISGYRLTAALKDGELGLVTACVIGHPALINKEIAEDYLLVTELKEIANQALIVLSTISPCYGYSNIKAWEKKIQEGFVDNYPTAQLLGQCYDLSGGMTARFIERPDRYFGIPLNQLLDCHLIAYRAARSWYEKQVAS